MREQAALAQKDGIAAVDPESWRFSGEKYINWVLPLMEKEGKK
jgi:hypothetical protein